MNPSFERRRLLVAGAAAGGTLLVGRAAAQAPAIIAAPSARPRIPFGIQLGDPVLDAPNAARTLVWAKADRPARLRVEWAHDASFSNPVRMPGALAFESNDCTARIDLTGLPPGREIHVRVQFEDIDRARTASEPITGRLRTPSARAQDLRFVWSGDTAGQGWGIDLTQGGMTSYEAMRRVEPAFFIHSGDTIYADGPIEPEKRMPDGRIWKNLTTPEKSKVAETLDEFRGNFRYNLLDANVLRFSREVPQIWQWDDHEVSNNWSGSKDLSGDPRYTEKNVGLLVARAAQAFQEYAPMRHAGDIEPQRVYRKLPQGPLLDVFMLDMRSYRGSNSANLQPEYGPEAWFLGPDQLAWLERELKASRAVWKVLCADMPLGLEVGDGKDAQGRARWEAVANGDPGRALGRELETARLLGFIKREKIRNTVWLTADVHYAAAHHYDPKRASFTDFDPFWEFVAGPLHAGAFGPNALDPTFGPLAVYQNAPTAQNLPPTDENQFFGQVDIDARTRAMTVALKNRKGEAVYTRTLEARRG